MATCLQFSIAKKTYLIRFRAGFFLLCAFFVALFFMLGVWQVHRYHFKKNLLAVYQNNLIAEPQAFPTDVTQFQHIKVEGQYVNELTMLIQNRIYHDQMGYEVLTPLKIANDKLLLVDRGWVPEAQFKNIQNTTTQKQNVTGHIKLLNESQFILGQNILNPKSKPLVMQKIDITEIEKITQQIFYPFILRLDASQPNGFVRDWIISSMPPERHMGYAVQWFALALMLLIAYFCFCCERVEPNAK